MFFIRISTLMLSLERIEYANRHIDERQRKNLVDITIHNPSNVKYNSIEKMRKYFIFEGCFYVQNF